MDRENPKNYKEEEFNPALTIRNPSHRYLHQNDEHLDRLRGNSCMGYLHNQGLAEDKEYIRLDRMGGSRS